MKNRFACLLYVSFSLISILNCNAQMKLSPVSAAEKLNVEYPLNKASPQDSTEYSIQIDGKDNTVIVNGRLMKNTPDSISKNGKIYVRGKGNIVNIKNSETKSEVIIHQKGNKNQINIIQNKK